MLAGGGYSNGSFLHAGLIDEVNIVMAPVAADVTAWVNGLDF